MSEELERSKDQLKLQSQQRPYYVEYSVIDLDQYSAEAEFGGVRVDQRGHNRLVRAVVRIGDYKQDSFYAAGQGVVDLLPIDDNGDALRHTLWIATDRAYKSAAAALTQKQAVLKQYETEQGVDDFSREQAKQSFAKPQALDVDTHQWRELARSISAMYTADPDLESWRASVNFSVQTRYFVNSEGTVLRQSRPQYLVALNGSTQSSDGMRLDLSRTWAIADAKELPSPQDVKTAAEKTLARLKELRSAPQVEEEYRGPVLFSADASGSIFAGLVAPNIEGNKPRFGTFGRTSGDYASSYKVRVLPDFLSVADDPTTHRANGRTLLGSYDYDDEGVAARAVTVIDKGQLTNYLVGRQPIRDFGSSNGHGRAAVGGAASPNIGNLFVRASQTAKFDELKARLIQMCKDQARPYAYYVQSMGGASNPRLLYRVYASDGHQELVRGAIFNQLDTRALRSNIVAASDETEVDNRAEAIPISIIAPALLFDELELKRTTQSKEKLPLYPPPEKAATAIVVQ
jgi:TldD protein